MEVIGRFPDLLSLNGILAEDGQALSQMELEEYSELVEACAAANASLKEITFTAQKSSCTDGKWVRRTDETWECYFVEEGES